MVLPKNRRTASNRPRAMPVANPLDLANPDPLPLPISPAQMQPPDGYVNPRTHQRGPSMSSARQVQAVAGPSKVPELPDYVTPYPRFLAPPYHPNIDDAAFRARFPEFGDDVPLAWLREVVMPEVAVVMLDGVSGCDIEFPPSSRYPPLPSHMRITFPLTASREGACPTHILAVPPPPGGRATRYALFPIHSAWIAVHCSFAPPFPESETEAGPGDYTRTAVLPVVEYALPSPDTFHALRTYLYNRNEEELQDYLAPPQRSKWAGSFNKADRQAGIIFGVWRNAGFMGVVGTDIWAVINSAWAIVYPVRQEFIVNSH